MKLTKAKLQKIIKEEIALGKRFARAGKAFADEIPDPDKATVRDSMIFQKKLYELITDRLGPSKDTAVEMGFLIADVAQLAGAYFGEEMKAAFDKQNESGVYDELKRELGIK
jgi:Cu/Ag efflux protein CusF